MTTRQPFPALVPLGRARQAGRRFTASVVALSLSVVAVWTLPVPDAAHSDRLLAAAWGVTAALSVLACLGLVPQEDGR